MPFLNLDNNWSNLAQYYNKPFDKKPKIPTIRFTGFDDGLIRGGVTNATIASTEDALRIGKFFASGKGGLFIIKQEGLQLSNPQLEQLPSTSPLKQTTKQGFLNNISNTITNFITNKSSTQIYNLGLNTLSQVPLLAVGEHIVRHGLLPKTTSTYNYEAVVTENNKKGNNRLVGYLGTIIKSINYPVLLSSYKGGPDSTYGIGTTNVKTTEQRTTINVSDLDSSTNPHLVQKLNGFSPLTNSEIEVATKASLSSNLYHQLSGSALSHNNVIALYNVENRIGVSTSKNVDAINTISINTWDNFSKFSASGSINAINAKSDLFTYTSGSEGKANGGLFGRDIIKFRIEFLDNDNNKQDVLAFRAYIDDFSDGMQAKWNSYRYMGRGEDFYVYDGFTRDIYVAFTIYAHSPEEMKPLYQKLNYLMSSFAPDYNSYNKMRGNIGYLTVGDYVYRQPGVFTDIRLSGMLDTHWEIAYDDKINGLSNQYEVPKHIKVNLSFKPIHNFLPRRVNKDHLIDAPFITRNDPNNKYLNQTEKKVSPITNQQWAAKQFFTGMNSKI